MAQPSCVSPWGRAARCRRSAVAEKPTRCAETAYVPWPRPNVCPIMSRAAHRGSAVRAGARRTDAGLRVRPRGPVASLLGSVVRVRAWRAFAPRDRAWRRGARARLRLTAAMGNATKPAVVWREPVFLPPVPAPATPSAVRASATKGSAAICSAFRRGNPARTETTAARCIATARASQVLASVTASGARTPRNAVRASAGRTTSA